MENSTKVRGGIAVAVATACAVTLLATATTLAAIGHRGAHPSPNPTDSEPGKLSSDGFAEVDWGYWKELNPDIVGWITIPGTAIDLPIVQARADNPRYYLDHDVFGEPSFMGCPYLDADCVRNGGLLACPNSVVLGHNMGWNSEMFGELGRFAEEDFASDHDEVLVQTPKGRWRLHVEAAEVIPGWVAAKRVAFSSEADFHRWWKGRFAGCPVKLVEHPRACMPLLTLCACSYREWPDERVLVYCAVGSAEEVKL